MKWIQLHNMNDGLHSGKNEHKHGTVAPKRAAEILYFHVDYLGCGLG